MPAPEGQPCLPEPSDAEYAEMIVTSIPVMRSREAERLFTDEYIRDREERIDREPSYEEWMAYTKGELLTQPPRKITRS